MTPLFLEIQADCCTAFSVSGITPAGETIDMGWVSEAEGVAGLRSRITGLRTDTPVAALRIAPVQGDGDYAVSAIRVSADKALSHATIVYIAWGLFLVLVVVKRFAPRAIGDLFDVWARADAPLALVVISTLVFRPISMVDAVAPMTVAVTATAAIAALVVVACRQAFQRLSYPALLYNGVIIVLAVWLVPRILATVVEQSVFRDYEPTIDHRMRPDGNEVNVDSIRFRGVSESIDAEDFNIVFLGDSFTFGYDLEYEDSVPYVMEKHLASHTCDSLVRVINFGWTSSSPLLSLRLLIDIGHNYHPDLVVYMLDMTDFHDDLDYGQQFISLQGPLIPPSTVAFRLLERAALAVFDRSEIVQILANVRTSLKREQTQIPAQREQTQIPAQRFFVTNQPLANSVQHIELGVMKNLGLIYDYATNALGAQMVLVVPPRAYQYTDRESPDNWEAAEYEALGMNVLAPFHYFERKQNELPYDVFSLLPAFRQSSDFPLYFRDDPHWNPAGARVAAHAITDFLLTEGMVPCAH